MSLLLDTNVVSELRKVRAGKVTRPTAASTVQPVAATPFL